MYFQSKPFQGQKRKTREYENSDSQRKRKTRNNNNRNSASFNTRRLSYIQEVSDSESSAAKTASRQACKNKHVAARIAKC
jgi:hypothetical protein